MYDVLCVPTMYLLNVLGHVIPIHRAGRRFWGLGFVVFSMLIVESNVISNVACYCVLIQYSVYWYSIFCYFVYYTVSIVNLNIVAVYTNTVSIVTLHIHTNTVNIVTSHLVIKILLLPSHAIPSTLPPPCLSKKKRLLLLRISLLFISHRIRARTQTAMTSAKTPAISRIYIHTIPGHI